MTTASDLAPFGHHLVEGAEYDGGRKWAGTRLLPIGHLIGVGAKIHPPKLTYAYANQTLLIAQARLAPA